MSETHGLFTLRTIAQEWKGQLAWSYEVSVHCQVILSSSPTYSSVLIAMRDGRKALQEMAEEVFLSIENKYNEGGN